MKRLFLLIVAFLITVSGYILEETETGFEIVLAEQGEEKNLRATTLLTSEEGDKLSGGPEVTPPVKILNPKDILKPGEEFSFGIRYLGVRVGIGTLKIEKITLVNGRPSYHLVSTARSTGIFALIYQVNERLDSFMDITGQYSLRFEQHSYGRRPHSQITTFDQNRLKIHDPISAFYYLRLHPLKVGEEVEVDVNAGREENYRIGVRVVGNKKVQTAAGEFDCLIVEPYFKDRDDPQKKTLKIYLTNDIRKIPVLITSKLPFGQVVLSLEKIRG